MPAIPMLPKPYRNRDLVRTLQAALALPPPVPRIDVDARPDLKEHPK